VPVPPRRPSDFEDDRKDERALGGVFVDIALEVNANFFLDDGPVGLFLGVRLFDGLEDDLASASHELGAIVAEHTPGDDFGEGFQAAGMLVDGDNGNDDAVLGEVTAVADDHLFDFLERAGIHEDAARGDGIAAESGILGEFDDVAIFKKQDFAGDDAEGMREGRMPEEMAVFAVDGDEIARLDELENELLFFLAGVPGDMDDTGGIVVVNESAAAEHVVEHAVDGLFVAGDDARGEDDGVVFLDGNKAVIVHGDAGERGHRLGLRAAGENDDAARVKAANILRADDHAVGNLEIAERVGDFDVIDHAAADKGDFAVNAPSDVNDLLDAVHRGSEAGENDAARSGAAEVLDARNDGALGLCEAGALDVRGIAEESEDAFVTIAGEGVKVELPVVHGRLVNLEIAGVDDDAERSTDSKRDAVDSTVGHGNEFNFIRADFDAAAGRNLAKDRGIEEIGFLEALLDQSEREARAVNGNIEVAKDIGKRADVVFMAMSEDNGTNVSAILLEVGDIGDDEINAEEFGFREHHTGVDDDDVVAVAQGHHVHAEFAEAAEGDGKEGVGGLTQGSVSS